MSTMAAYANQSPPAPIGPAWHGRVVLRCPSAGAALTALHRLAAHIDEALSAALPGRFERHVASAAGPDKLAFAFVSRADSLSEALREGGVVAHGILELCAAHDVTVDLTAGALTVNAAPASS